MKNRGDIIFFILVFILQTVISDYIQLGHHGQGGPEC